MSTNNSLPTILVVDDEESFIEALQVGLKREGFRIEVARDGAEALAVFNDIKPDAVLLDVMLPKVSGTDVCREIRKRAPFQSSWCQQKVQRLTRSLVLKLVLMTMCPSPIACANSSLECELSCEELQTTVVANCQDL